MVAAALVTSGGGIVNCRQRCHCHTGEGRFVIRGTYGRRDWIRYRMKSPPDLKAIFHRFSAKERARRRGRGGRDTKQKAGEAIGGAGRSASGCQL